jgi:septal ring factor EnvC (AmiA/AmiB activator)
LWRPEPLWTLTALLLLSGAAAAEPAPPDDPGRRLREVEGELVRSRALHDEIRSRAADLAAETARVRGEMVKAARAAQESEDRLSELEAQLDELGRREAADAEALQRRARQQVGVLTALMRLAWRPTEALIAQPQSPAETVRSAILLRAAVPQIEHSAADLRGEIAAVTKLREAIGEKKARIAATTGQLEQERHRLEDLVERKSQIQRDTEAQRSVAEARMRDLAAQADDLRDLMARLEQERQRRVAEAAEKAAAEKAAREAEKAAREAAAAARLAAEKAARDAQIAAAKAEREAEAAARAQAEQAAREARAAARRAPEPAAPPPPAPQPSAPPPAGEAAVAARDAEQAAQAEAARTQAEAARTQAEADKAGEEAEQASREAAATRLTRTGKPFSQMQGLLPFPARGRVVETFGQVNAVGHTVKGIVIQTRKGAQVIAPYDGQVVFAGPFRGYGLLLILEHSEGYHTLLAGLDRVDASVGQRLLAGEPVGVMGQDDAKPTLYVELRHHGQPVNPLPWLMARKNKASG